MMKTCRMVCPSLLLVILIPLSLYSQDWDFDGIPDCLEYTLALKFAPEWRFNFKVPRDGSQQNNNENYFPSSVEGFHREVRGITGEYPVVVFSYNRFPPDSLPITDMSQLTGIRDPAGDRKRADSDYWSNRRDYLRIGNYPLYMGGDPQYFPTHFHCSVYDSGSFEGSLVLEYYLWFPDDHTGGFTFLDLEFGNHRGDWESIAVVVEGVTDMGMNSCEVPSTASISNVIYYGHFTPGKRVPYNDIAMHLVEGTHPQVFVAWGTHAMYPEPGEWHNAKLGGPNAYDDFFHGNGLVAKSWLQNRELINLGEIAHPLVPWLLYNGLWGPDGTEKNGSPPSPQYRGRWSTVGRAGDWATIKLSYQAWWERPIEIDRNVLEPFGFEADGQPTVVLFEHEHWRGKSVAMSIGNHTNIDLISGEVSSVWLLGGTKVTLYSGSNLSGQAFELTHSCENLESHYNHRFNDAARSATVTAGTTPVYVNPNNFAGYQDGSQFSGTLSGPYSTIGRAVFNVKSGGQVIAEAGNYREILSIDKPVVISSSGGPVVIGRFQ